MEIEVNPEWILASDYYILAKKYEKEIAENKKLREALEEIIKSLCGSCDLKDDNCRFCEQYQEVNIAEKALQNNKEIE
jgi:hypothetical protein